MLGTISTFGAAFILLGGYALVKIVRHTRERRERAAPAPQRRQPNSQSY